MSGSVPIAAFETRSKKCQKYALAGVVGYVRLPDMQLSLKNSPRIQSYFRLFFQIEQSINPSVFWRD